MFPTMEILLRHSVNYLNMKKSKAVASSGIIDDEEALIRDMDKLSLDERRAVLCTHMLCYVLDGNIGGSELELWKRSVQPLSCLDSRSRSLPRARLTPQASSGSRYRRGRSTEE